MYIIYIIYHHTLKHSLLSLTQHSPTNEMLPRHLGPTPRQHPSTSSSGQCRTCIPEFLWRLSSAVDDLGLHRRSPSSSSLRSAPPHLTLSTPVNSSVLNRRKHVATSTPHRRHDLTPDRLILHQKTRQTETFHFPSEPLLPSYCRRRNVALKARARRDILI